MEPIGTVQPVQPGDLLDAAMNPQEPTRERHYFGEVTITDYWECILQKGIGKVLFDPTVHSLDQRCIAVKICVQPFEKDWSVDQETLTFEKEWKNFTLPSLKQLGLDLLSIRGKFVHIKRTPTGETYTNKQGETKDRTAIVFIEIFPNRETCRQAANTFFKERKSADANNTNPQSTAASAQAQPATDQAEREFAKSSLSMLWQVSGQNKDQFLNMIKSNTMIAKHFDETSPEVQAILSPELMA
jgi:hypothetical protein